MKIAVVGAGAMGLSTALAAIRRGHTVELYDQFEPLHTLGSSHGNSRIVRLDYPDPFYLGIMLEAYPLWSELNRRLQEPIFHETGIFTFGDPAHPDLVTLEQGLNENKIAYERLTPGQTRFPALQLQPGEIAIHNPVAGWANADLFRREANRFLAENGVARVHQFVQNPAALGKDADAVVVTAGAWAKHLFGLPVQVVCQTFAYLPVASPAAHTKVWIETGEHGIYGFPPESATADRIKFGVHSPGPEVDPAHPDRPVTAEKLDLLRDFAARRFGDPDPQLADPQSCLYTVAANNDFRWGSADPGVFWVSPCSGHGFKFAPWIGERMVDLAEEKLSPGDYPRFHQSA